jgi:hypothetical protein
MGGIVSVLYDAIAYQVFCGITLRMVAPLFNEGNRHPNRLGFLLALFGDQYRRHRRQLRMLIFTTGQVCRRRAADRNPGGPSRTTYQWALGD